MELGVEAPARPRHVVAGFCCGSTGPVANALRELWRNYENMSILQIGEP